MPEDSRFELLEYRPERYPITCGFCSFVGRQKTHGEHQAAGWRAVRDGHFQSPICPTCQTLPSVDLW